MTKGFRQFCFIALSLLSVAVSLPALAEAVQPPHEPKKLGVFEGLNFQRKLISIALSMKGDMEEVKTADQAIQLQFSSAQLDEKKLKSALLEGKEAFHQFSKGIGDMINLLAEYDQGDILKFGKNDQGPEDSDDKDSAVPASFSPDSIRRIREIKARNRQAREEMKALLKIKNPLELVKLVRESETVRMAFVDKMKEMGEKNFDLEVAEYREMRTFLSAEEMKTYFTLQRQLEEKRAKDSADKKKALASLAKEADTKPKNPL